MSASTQTKGAATAHYDAVVVGAGFGGLYMLHRLRDQQGLRVRLFDRAGDIGGTWYWNRYPGARSDTDSYLYCYSFDKELLQEWSWSDRFPLQPEVLRYLNRFTERHDLRRDIQFNTSIVAAHFNEQTQFWDLQTDGGARVTAKYLVTALGLLSATNLPAFKGREQFKGERYHTGAWPVGGVDFKGKRVGLIGTGSTGVQVVISVAPEAKHLTVFQRSAQYSVPARHGPMTDAVYRDIKINYERIWGDAFESAVAFGFKESTVPAMSVSDAEREDIFEEAWQLGGGFRFMFGTFCDIATDRQANEAAAAFIRKKISQIVGDPETARKLTPTDLYAKRPLCDTGYYDTYNRSNVTLVDLKSDPIVEITEKGVRTQTQEHELDVLVFATGFDAVDGNYVKVDIRGRGGVSIKERWAGGPTSYLGMANPGFPNLFMVLGPNGPFTNLPPSIETQVEWISDLIRHAESCGLRSVEATAQAQDRWSAVCNEIAHMTLFPKAESWIFGANIPGKPNVVMFYMGGLRNYREVLAQEVTSGYSGFLMERARSAA